MADGVSVKQLGPEAAVPLPDGRSIPVSLSMPKIPAVAPMQRVTNLSFNIDARYATKGVSEEVRDQMLALAPVMTKAAVDMSRKEFPSNLSNTLRDKG